MNDSNGPFRFGTPNLRKLTEFGFSTDSNLDCPVGDLREGILELGQHQLNVRFRVRSIADGIYDCSFFELPLRDQQIIAKHIKAEQRFDVGNSDLTSRSYDELAAGITSSDANRESGSQPVGGKTSVKSLVLLAMTLTMLGLVLVAFLFMRSKSSLSVTNSTLVGNYVPINARTEGEVIEVNFSEGDFVRKGDVLLRLSNPNLILETRDCESEQMAADAKVVALQKQLEGYRRKVGIASKKLDIDLEVARTNADSIGKQVAAARTLTQRMAPFVERSVTRLEYDTAVSAGLALEAEHQAALSEVKVREFAKDASKENILILGDRLDDEYGRLQAELDILVAEKEYIARKVELLSQQESQLEICAPRDGFVFANYRQPGEFLRAADEAIALSFPGDTWASGLVTANQAQRVCPGQPVSVNIPSLRKRIPGIVSAVGHRAIYSKGNYSAEFRGATATDVPIKVFIGDLPAGVPSGMRLEMTVSTGFGVDWLDELTGFELKKITRRPNTEELAPNLATSDGSSTTAEGKLFAKTSNATGE